MYVCMHVCMYVCMYVYVCMCAYLLCVASLNRMNNLYML